MNFIHTNSCETISLTCRCLSSVGLCCPTNQKTASSAICFLPCRLTIYKYEWFIFHMYSLPANVSFWLPLTTAQVHAQFVNTRFQDKILPSGWDLSKRLKRLTANAKVATVLGSIPASADTLESKGRQIKQSWSKNKTKIPLITKKFQARLARPTYFTSHLE